MRDFLRACVVPFAGDPTGGASGGSEPKALQESSLADLMQQLPGGHRARREYEELIATKIEFDPDPVVPQSQVWSA